MLGAMEILEAIKAVAISLQDFANHYPCTCDYHGPDCERKIAQDFVHNWIVEQAQTPKERIQT